MLRRVTSPDHRAECAPPRRLVGMRAGIGAEATAFGEAQRRSPGILLGLQAGAFRVGIRYAERRVVKTLLS